MKNECSIVRDLLPLYAEGMLSEDSAAFVKEHLDTCEECRALSAGEEPSAPTDADTEQRTGEAGVLRTLKRSCGSRPGAPSPSPRRWCCWLHSCCG